MPAAHIGWLRRYQRRHPSGDRHTHLLLAIIAAQIANIGKQEGKPIEPMDIAPFIFTDEERQSRLDAQMKAREFAEMADMDAWMDASLSTAH